MLVCRSMHQVVCVVCIIYGLFIPHVQAQCVEGARLVDGVCVKDRVVFGLDSRSGDARIGPDGSVPYTSPMSPSLGTCSISGGSLTLTDNTVIPRGMQVWTVQATGVYNIVAGGAAGSDATATSFGVGRGAVVWKSHTFNAGDKVVIAVGQRGAEGGFGGRYTQCMAQ